MLNPVQVRPPSRQVSAGLSLIEIMIALAILSFSLLGIAALQTIGTRLSSAAYYRSQAVVLASDLADRMRANPAGIAAYTASSTSPVPDYRDNCHKTACTGQALAEFDLATWHRNLQRLLPGGEGGVTNHVNAVRIIVRWRDNRVDGGESGLHEFMLSVRL